MVIFFVCLIALLILLVIYPVKFRILNIGDDTDIEISFLSFIKIHLDYQKFVGLFYKDNSGSISRKKILNNIMNFFVNKDDYFLFMKTIIIKKSVIVSHIAAPDSDVSPYVYASNWAIINQIKELINAKFHLCLNEYYGVVENYEGFQTDVDFDFILILFPYRLLYTYLKIKTVKIGILLAKKWNTE